MLKIYNTLLYSYEHAFSQIYGRTYIIHTIFMTFYKILSLFWCFLLNTHTTDCLFSETSMGTLLHNVVIALSDFGPSSLLGSVPLPATSVFIYLADHSEACCRTLQLLSRPGLKDSNKSPRNPDQLLPWAYSGQNLPSTDISMQDYRQQIPSTEDTWFVKVWIQR
jgi:hypothetical protein